MVVFAQFASSLIQINRIFVAKFRNKIPKHMQEAIILKLIILALAATFIAVIIALVLSFSVTKKLMKHNANLIDQVKESDKQQASTQQTLYEKENELLKTDEQLMGWIDAQIESPGLYKNHNVTIKEISKALGLTQRRSTQAIKTRREDNTLAEYLNAKRLLEGCRLLVEQPNWTVDAVAHEAGFGGTTTFRTVFRNRFGMSPKQYREKKRLMG